MMIIISKMNTNFVLFIWLLILILLSKKVYASVGDSSPFFNHCVKSCHTETCERGNLPFNLDVFRYEFLLWSCKENCEYLCQWKTVEAFQNNNWKIPQFKGKWPFIRLYGLQEPASVLFSTLNFLVILKMIIRFRKKVPNSSPYYYIWHFYAAVCLNCWIWSSIYHGRDTEFTEKMDYMSAFLMVVSSLYTAGLRHFGNKFNVKTLLWTIFCGTLALHHLSYLYFYYFDYDYNMKVNCAVGCLTISGWFVWSLLNFPEQFYAWKAAAYGFLVAVSTLFEVMDFPPIFWLVDAHALWHLSTVFINQLFYSLIIDDCIFLSEVKHEKLESESKIK